jgi:hypothetical protein
MGLFNAELWDILSEYWMTKLGENFKVSFYIVQKEEEFTNRNQWFQIVPLVSIIVIHRLHSVDDFGQRELFDTSYRFCARTRNHMVNGKSDKMSGA